MGILSQGIVWFAYIASIYFMVFWFMTFFEKRHEFKSEECEEQKITKFPFVSVLIPAYNEEVHISETIDSVLNLNYPSDRYEIIVINDGSSDNTKQKVQEMMEKNPERSITLIDQHNQGKANSLNNALKISKGEFFACLDADSYVGSESLRRQLYIYEKEDDPHLVIVTPAMKVRNPKKLIEKFQRIEYLSMMFMGRLMSHIDCVYVAPGPFSLYRTSIIKTLGGFDPNSLTEDQEIAYRAQTNHYRIKHCYNAYVYTATPKKIGHLMKQRNR